MEKTMKSTLRNWLFLVCALVTLIGVSACSDDDEGTTYVYTYTAGGEVSSSGSIEGGLSALTAITDYTAAIQQAIGGSYATEPCDEKVITACEAVYMTHRANHPEWVGEIHISRGQYDLSTGETSSSTTIQTYTYE